MRSRSRAAKFGRDRPQPIGGIGNRQRKTDEARPEEIALYPATARPAFHMRHCQHQVFEAGAVMFVMAQERCGERGGHGLM